MTVNSVEEYVAAHGVPYHPTMFSVRDVAGDMEMCTLPGITLRERFALAAMQAIIASETDHINRRTIEDCVAERAFRYADAMMERARGV